ncbi:MAG: type IV pilus secretin PilQ, partial [Pseudomonadota bacterium]
MNKQALVLQAGSVVATLQSLLGHGTLRAWLCLVFAGFFAASTQAQTTNSIQSVTGSVQGGSEIIRVDLAEPLTVLPTGFSIQTPARIALDFPGIGNSMGRSAVDLNLGNLRS